MEIWKSIPWTGGRIEISNQGRVRSNLRDGRILKSTPSRKGYLKVRVTLDGVKRTITIHREVAKAFIDNPGNLPQVNHIDGDKSNNTVKNLEWVSNLDNARHAVENGLWKNVFAASQRTNESRKRPIVATKIDTGESLYFASMSDAERCIGTKHINAVLKGERKQASGFTFQYATV